MASYQQMNKKVKKPELEVMVNILDKEGVKIREGDKVSIYTAKEQKRIFLWTVLKIHETTVFLTHSGNYMIQDLCDLQFEERNV